MLLKPMIGEGLCSECGAIISITEGGICSMCKAKAYFEQVGIYTRICKTCGKEFKTRGDFTLECSDCQSKNVDVHCKPERIRKEDVIEQIVKANGAVIARLPLIADWHIDEQIKLLDSLVTYSETVDDDSPTLVDFINKKIEQLKIKEQA